MQSSVLTAEKQTNLSCSGCRWMQENEYNIISFQTDIYINSAVLDINPNPDAQIRVFMAYKASETAVYIEAQAFTAPERTGFTVVEWGGTEVK